MTGTNRKSKFLMETHLRGWYLARGKYMFPPFHGKVRKSIVCY